MVSDKQLLVLIGAQETRDELVDLLMAQTYLSGFSLSDIAGYSAEHSEFSVQEQVAGSRLMCRFEVMLHSCHLDQLKQALSPVCVPAGVRYWLLPVLSEGHFQ